MYLAEEAAVYLAEEAVWSPRRRLVELGAPWRGLAAGPTAAARVTMRRPMGVRTWKWSVRVCRLSDPQGADPDAHAGVVWVPVLIFPLRYRSS